MPKENTHLFFAHSLIEKLESENKKLVERNLDCYYPGAVAPDIFFFGKTLAELLISAEQHGKNGEPTNKIIFQMLDWAKKNQDQKNLVFTLGYLTHCALDQTFHPVIVYLTGNVFNPDPIVRATADYRHREWETALDKKINHGHFYGDLIDIRQVYDLKFCDIIKAEHKVRRKRIIQLLKWHALVNRLIRSRLVYRFMKLLFELGIYKRKEDLALSYYNLPRGQSIIPERLEYRDIITGEKRTTTINELLTAAQNKALAMIGASVDYYHGRIDRVRLEKCVPGESLETGRLNCPVTAIKFLKD